MKFLKNHFKNFFNFIFLVFLLVGCNADKSNRRQEFEEWIKPNDKLKVLSTTAMIQDLVKRIGNGHIDSITLIQGNLDPHSYQLVKGDDEKLSYAHIIFFNGLGLEHGPSLYAYLQNNSKAVSLGDAIEKRNPEAIVFINGQKDPHIWTDVSLWVQTIPIIVETLSEKDPAHAQEYKENGNRLKDELLQVHGEIKNIMGVIPENRRYLVTSHDAFNYFTRAYLSDENEITNNEWRKRFAAPEGLAPESQLSVTDIKAIINHMKNHHIHLLFPESNVSRDSINKILQAGREQGLELEITCCPLYADAMGPPGSEGDTYSKMMMYNAKMLARYMDPTKRSQATSQ